MAVTETRSLVNPTLEGSLTAFLKKLDPLGGQQINTAAYAPKVAARNALQTAPETAAAGLGALTGTGAGAADVAGSIASYMSPYQQEVIDTSLAEFDRKAAIDQNALRDQAISRGAYGGGREGVMQAQYMNQGAMNRAQLQAQLLNQGYTQANQFANQDLMNRQGLGTYMNQMGQDLQGYEQAKLDAGLLANREAQYEPYTRLGLIGNMLASINPGSFGSTTVGYQPSAAPASPMASWLGGAAGAGGVLGKLGIFG